MCGRGQDWTSQRIREFVVRLSPINIRSYTHPQKVSPAGLPKHELNKDNRHVKENKETMMSQPYTKN